MTARDWLHIALGAWVGFNLGIVFVMVSLTWRGLWDEYRATSRRLRED